MDEEFLDDFSKPNLTYPRYITLASTEPQYTWRHISEDLYIVKVSSYEEAALAVKGNVYVATSSYI